MNLADCDILTDLNRQIADEKQRADTNFATARDAQEENERLKQRVAVLEAQVKRLQQERHEAEREFQREARDIAAEARWAERAARDDVPYGSH